MTLVDTSVVIDFLRSGDAKLHGLFQSLPGAICGVTRAEVLHGVRALPGRLLPGLSLRRHRASPCARFFS